MFGGLTRSKKYKQPLCTCVLTRLAVVSFEIVLRNPNPNLLCLLDQRYPEVEAVAST